MSLCRELPERARRERPKLRVTARKAESPDDRGQWENGVKDAKGANDDSVQLATITVGGKINLFLNVKERLENGYHALETLFLPIEQPCDTLVIGLMKSGRRQSLPTQNIEVICAKNGVNTKQNTLTRAFELYASATGFAPSLVVTLLKGIPIGAGLGGGSADAAALLVFLQNFARQCGQAGLEHDTLCSLAAKVGADVPFFLRRKPALASGIGEILREVPHPCPGYHLLLVCPHLAISTARAFAMLDESRVLGQNAVKAEACRPGFCGDSISLEEISNRLLTIDQCRDSKFDAWGVRLTNSFEAVVFAAWPELSRYKRTLLEQGAIHAMLSGSGSSLFGIFRDKDGAKRAKAALKHESVRLFLQRCDAGVSPSW